MSKFSFLRVFFSPFIMPKLRIYAGKLMYGVPYFYPRKWVKNKKKPGYSNAIPKKIGFDFVGLGWKTKWENTDYRHEWNPIWSFVFFKWQICLFFVVPECTHYWESWLYYTRNTNKSTSTIDRLQKCMKEFPNIWTVSDANGKRTVNYYKYILKTKWVNKLKFDI